MSEAENHGRLDATLPAWILGDFHRAADALVDEYVLNVNPDGLAATATDEWSENRVWTSTPRTTPGGSSRARCFSTPLMGVLDPDEQLEASENTFAVIPLHEESEN